MYEWVGFGAALLTTIAFVPQLYRVYQLKSAHDVSYLTYMILCTGVFLWLVYGILLNDLPLILANAITLVIALGILVLKIKYERQR
ncbi:MAG: SemiSWEET family sugar transporter [Leptospiraceae bacterium]|nr:SemiSWEET family sugar transporter [Leptospiraceae bacterium]MCB1315278.1 SemiSWEET family sugar transporter [Leptospiraceae bacterium]MCB1319373.1 SemiSWEET family sugar transporter [Leptospiraceae bacterium]